jgi:accessory gene regulator B
MGIEEISRIIAFKISSRISLKNEEREIVEYGLKVFLSEVFSLSILFIVLFVTGLIKTGMSILIAAGVLRKFSGGAHCSSPMRCTILGVMTVPLFAFSVERLLILGENKLLAAAVCLNVLSLFNCLKYAPADSPQKPINEVSKKRLKRGVLLLISITSSVLIAGYFSFYIDISFISAVSVGFFYQSITLTPAGYRFTAAMDRLMQKII